MMMRHGGAGAGGIGAQEPYVNTAGLNVVVLGGGGDGDGLRCVAPLLVATAPVR